MEDMYSDNTPIPQLRAIFEGAQRFGLSEDEAWRAVDGCLHVVGTEATIAEYLDELTAALARRILCAERQSASS
jgi:hypothetical protein